MKLEMRSMINHTLSITATQLNPNNPRSSEEKPRKALKIPDLGQNPTFLTTGQIIS